MKVILSKKGFDSTIKKINGITRHVNGGIPSPIMPDGSLLSLPIPTLRKYGVKFSDLSYGGKTYQHIISELNHDKPLISNKSHLDPDIRESIITKRNKGWMPLFGQTNAPLGHLNKEQIGIGDLFLFFGWFKRTEWIKVNGRLKLQYKKEETDKHIIFGYLQIGNIYKKEDILNDFPEQLHYHPHYQNRKDNINYKYNCIYEASETFSFLPNLPGAGCFKYDDSLRLTKEGNYSKTKWELRDIFKKDRNIKISGIIDPYKKEYYQSCKTFGQEFVIHDNKNKDVEKWAKNIIRAGAKAK